MTSPEPGDRRMIQEEPRADHPKSDVLVAGALDLARAVNPQTVGIDQKRDHRLWVMSRTSPAVLPAVGVEGMKVHLIDAVENEPHEVIFWEPLGQRRRQQVELVSLRGDEVVHHSTIFPIAPSQVADITHALQGVCRSPRGFVQQAQ